MFTAWLIIKGVLAYARGDTHTNDYRRVQHLYGLRSPRVRTEWQEFLWADSRKLHHLQDVVTEWFKEDAQRGAKLWQDTAIGVVVLLLVRFFT